MEFIIGIFNPEAHQVPVSFQHAGVIHNREVNAVLTDGMYDEGATAVRVQEVANGVEQKIAAGVLPEQNPIIEEEAEPESEAETET